MNAEEKRKPMAVLRLNKRLLLRLVAAAAGAVLTLAVWPVAAPLAAEIVGQATLFSAALTMPQSALLSLRERFAGDDAESPKDDELAQLPPPSSTATPQSNQSPPPASQMPPQSLPPVQDAAPPEIPKEYRAALATTTMAAEEGNLAFLQHGNVWLRNYTKLSLEKIEKVLAEDCALQLGNAEAPQVLIYHTHTTESYEQFHNTVYDTRNSWRNIDNTNNMAAVGDVLVQELEKNGVNVIHDTEQHDYPSYNGAYDRSRKTVEQYLKEYPTIKVTIDLHRDGIIQSDNTVVKPVVEVGGRRAAQLMLIAPCDDGSVGVPGWRENLRFANELQASIENSVQGLCRPIFFCYRNYNLGLTGASLLFELGTNGNTLEEAKYTAQLLAKPLAEVILAHVST